MTLYCVQATVVHHTTDRHCLSADVARQVPTFYLDADAQAIANEGDAEQVAREIICPVDLQYESVTITMTVTRL